MRPNTLFLLVAAATRAWDFPWSSTEEGWAPTEDTRPEEDPFWVDREPWSISRRASVTVHAVAAESAPSGGGIIMRDLLFGFSLVAVLAAYAWLYAKDRSRITKVDEETSLLSQTEENPFEPNGLEITKF